MRENEKNEGNL